jgi:hypothetical protein
MLLYSIHRPSVLSCSKRLFGGPALSSDARARLQLLARQNYSLLAAPPPELYLQPSTALKLLFCTAIATYRTQEQASITGIYRLDFTHRRNCCIPLQPWPTRNPPR